MVGWDVGELELCAQTIVRVLYKWEECVCEWFDPGVGHCGHRGGEVGGVLFACACDLAEASEVVWESSELVVPVKSAG